MVVRHIPSENLSPFIALHVTFTFFISTAPSLHILSKNFLETELEAFDDKQIVPFFTTYHVVNCNWFHLHSSSVGRNWYTNAIPGN
jgi:hypothetical protein